MVQALIASLGAWAIQFFTRKASVLAVTVASFLMLTAAFLVCIKQMVLYVLTLAALPTWISTAVGMFMPYNFAIILANILAAQSCRWAYDKALDKIRLINSAN